MIAWWKRRQCGGGEQHEHAGSGRHHGGHEGWDASYGGEEGGGGPFGVRRPLRFLAYRLRLDEPQIAELARILNELKTERSQAAVDHRRSSGAIADALEGDTFDDAKVSAAAQIRVKTAETLRDAVVKALRQIHGVLKPEQRKELAYLLRTGQLLI